MGLVMCNAVQRNGRRQRVDDGPTAVVTTTMRALTSERNANALQMSPRIGHQATGVVTGGETIPLDSQLRSCILKIIR